MSQKIEYYEQKKRNGVVHCRTNPNSRFWFVMLSEEQARAEYQALMPTKYAMMVNDETIPDSWNKMLCYEFEQHMLNERELNEALPRPQDDRQTDGLPYELSR